MESYQVGKCPCGNILPDYPLLCVCDAPVCSNCFDTCINCKVHMCTFCTVLSPSGYFCSVCDVYSCEWCLDGNFQWVDGQIGCLKHVISCSKGHLRFKDHFCVCCENIVCVVCTHNEIQGKHYCDESLRTCSCGSVTSTHIPPQTLKYRGQVIIDKGCLTCVAKARETIGVLLIASRRNAKTLPGDIICMILRTQGHFQNPWIIPEVTMNGIAADWCRKSFKLSLIGEQ